MKKIIVRIIILAILLLVGFVLIARLQVFKGHSLNKESAGKKVLFYRNPMDPEVTSPVPMKDSMGMDYIPVYEKEEAKPGQVYISPEKQQLIGVIKEAVKKRNLIKNILTVGKVAYDPALAVTQTEYLQAMAARKKLDDPQLKDTQDAIRRADMLVDAAGKRLQLLGMSQAQIEQLSKENLTQTNLYLPKDGAIWVYMTIYEYEMGFIKEGMPVEIEAVAYPGEVFKGRIIAVNPILDAMTRSINVRAEVPNPENKLKPEMFVNAKIQVDLGEKLAVPESAVLDTGIRKIVYLAQGDMMEQREVNLGQKADGYFEVLSGLEQGDVVITSGNFLVDSESKLKGVGENSEHKHGQ